MKTGRDIWNDVTGLGLRLNPVWSPLVLALTGSLAGAQEAAEDIRDVKGMVEIPEPPNYALWIGLAAGVLVLAYLIWKFFPRKRKAIEISAADRALKVLDKCQALIAEESPEPLVIAVTGAVRGYLEERFALAAPRRTTEEFLRDVNAGPDPEIAPFREELGRFLHICDAVKFGRGEMAGERRRDLIEVARQFVESTRNPQPGT